MTITTMTTMTMNNTDNNDNNNNDNDSDNNINDNHDNNNNDNNQEANTQSKQLQSTNHGIMSCCKFDVVRHGVACDVATLWRILYLHLLPAPAAVALVVLFCCCPVWPSRPVQSREISLTWTEDQ